jgi:hypothetical protein
LIAAVEDREACSKFVSGPPHRGDAQHDQDDDREEEGLPTPHRVKITSE